MAVGDVVQRPVELIAQMSAVTAARMNVIHFLLLSRIPGHKPVRRPVAHPVNAFIGESWLKASPIRIAPTAGNRPVGQSACLIARTVHLTTTMVILMSSATRRFAVTPSIRLALPVLR